jgi:methionyl-tRNA formyltransferase
VSVRPTPTARIRPFEPSSSIQSHRQQARACGPRARLAVFTVSRLSFWIVRDWAERAGYDVTVLVTIIGQGALTGVRDLGEVRPGTAVVGVPSVAACAATLADLGVDLGIVYGFPIVPAAVAEIPRRGCVNLHPSLLPAFRGVNGYRSLFEGDPRIGATLHWLTPELDAGAILAQTAEEAPVDIEPGGVVAARRRVAIAALEAGVPRACAGDPGQPQDLARATPAPRFTEDETVLALDLTARQFQSRCTALFLSGMQPWVVLGGTKHPVRVAQRLPGLRAGAPGLVSLSTGRAIVVVADAVLELELGELPG